MSYARNIIKDHSSFVVVIPKELAIKYGIKKGQRAFITGVNNGIYVYFGIPAKETPLKAEKEA